MTLGVAFLGNHAWSVPALEAIDADPGLGIDLVVTNPPRRRGSPAAGRHVPPAEAGS